MPRTDIRADGLPKITVRPDRWYRAVNVRAQHPHIHNPSLTGGPFTMYAQACAAASPNEYVLYAEGSVVFDHITWYIDRGPLIS